MERFTELQLAFRHMIFAPLNFSSRDFRAEKYLILYNFLECSRNDIVKSDFQKKHLLV